MARQAFQSQITCFFIADGKSQQIDPNFIRYVLIQDYYEKYSIPVIYLSLAVSSDLYTTMTDHEKDGQFKLTIERINAYSDTALKRKSISGTFTYVMSTGNPNYTKNLNEETTDDSSYRAITLALFDMELLNKSKTSFNGVFKNIDTATLMYKALQDLRHVVVTKPKYNTTFDTEIIPVLNNRRKLIDYIFNQSPFYDTNFIFFMDFDRTYLIDQSGEGCEINNGELHDVIFDVRSVDDYHAYYEGIDIQNDAYYLYINPANTNITLNKGQDKIANQLVNVDEDGNITTTKLNINRNKGSTDKQAFERGQNAILKKNIMESSTIVIDIQKEYIDGSIFTPDKKYMVRNYDEYKQYDGAYTMIYKTEIILNKHGVFNSSVEFGLRKVGNIEEIGSRASKAASLNSTSLQGYSVNAEYTQAANMDGKIPKVASNKSGYPRNTKKKLSASNVRRLNTSFAGPVMNVQSKSMIESLKRHI